ncbi:MAG: SUMF1/EgtB/PvdO family nonheme iron enzyme, partial [Candidatus Delongbacteria bacterium]|nr:SUMF1/EgtB/PvdO family nonheme iron enzyme [Candidatus Delongbacteria bacterium]
TVLVGCTAWDSSGTVDAATLARRLDLNQDLDYGDAAEEWQELSGYTDAEYIVIQSSITFPADGLFHAEFRASDTAGNGPGYSLGIEGIGDDIVIRIDTTSPEATELALGGTTTGSVTLLFTPTEDLTFSRYEVYFAEDSLVDENDLLWGEANDPALAERDTYTTTVSGLAAAADYWFSMRVIDGLNHIGAWSQILPASTTGIAPAAVSDLAITTGDGGVHLSWTAPTVDENGNTPVTITGYEVHASNTAHFLPGIDTWIAGTTGTSFFHNNALESGTAVFYRVVVLGSGENSGELVLLPAGTFTMGQVGTNGIPEHQVTITSPCQLSDHEVTTVDYLLALQWAFDNGYVTASSSTVQAYGQELLDLDDVDCEIGFSDGIFTIQESLSSYAQNAYPAGYDPATHPVKEVSWYGAACYCDWRSLREGFPPYYNGDWSTGIGHNPYTADGYTLPTEAQWELAARYNDNRTYPWGETTPGCGYANMYDSGYCVGWTVPVASYPAGDSQLGLYDLAGNLWEWVNDWYAGYPAVPQSDPLGAASGAYRVMRGGGWTNNASSLRSASRNNSAPGTTDYGIGFRIALQD